VADQGGFRVGRGFGLAANEQRMVELGGHLRVEAAPGAGTALRAVLPVEGGTPG
jgi:signal transduction histidine kinase